MKQWRKGSLRAVIALCENFYGTASKVVVLTLAAMFLSMSGLLGGLFFLGEPALGTMLVRALGIPRPAIIAHRGASYLAPEETQPAFLMARALGADYLEFDVQRTKDGVLIVLHDDTLSRTTNVEEIYPGRVKDRLDTFTFAELQQLDAGSWFNAAFPERARTSFGGLRILRLEDVLDIAESDGHRHGVYIETKAAGRFPGIERQLVAVLTQRGWLTPSGSEHGAAIIFQSFEPDSLARFKELAPQVPRLLLIDEVMVAKDGWDAIIKKAASVGMGIGTWGYQWAYGAEWSKTDVPARYVMTWPWYTGQAHRAGLFVHSWPVDHSWEMWMVSLTGADGFFTNRTEQAVRVYGRRNDTELAALWDRIGY
ncbi:MAG TPA: glycerophosphodiester phosphodiesterase family protein [Nitrospira sp.]|nr:glycerophosphodiester phosphodiesterase family protein [Nitrospira sp.]